MLDISWNTEKLKKLNRTDIFYRLKCLFFYIEKNQLQYF